jgi:hypothetical protein
VLKKWGGILRDDGKGWVRCDEFDKGEIAMVEIMSVGDKWWNIRARFGTYVVRVRYLNNHSESFSGHM